MSACTCRLCGPVGCQRTVVEVTITIAITRPGWESSGFSTVWGEVETEHELRAAVSYLGLSEEPEVTWLDAAVVEDLSLTAAELEGAEEEALEAGYLEIREKYGDGPDVERGDYLYDQAKDAELWRAS